MQSGQDRRLATRATQETQNRGAVRTRRNDVDRRLARGYFVTRHGGEGLVTRQHRQTELEIWTGSAAPFMFG